MTFKLSKSAVINFNILFLLFLLLPIDAYSKGISDEYKVLLFKYADAALSEFSYSEKDPSIASSVDSKKGTYLLIKDRIGRSFYVALFPYQDRSTFVSMEINKDGFIEIHGKGILAITPDEFARNPKNNIERVISYPKSY